MSILLTTPYSPGDLDPGANYTHVELATFSGDFVAWRIRFSFVRGTVNAENNFVPGKLAHMDFIVRDKPGRAGSPPTTDYTDMMTDVSQDGELVSSAVARIIYVYVLTRGIFVGTPVDPNA